MNAVKRCAGRMDFVEIREKIIDEMTEGFGRTHHLYGVYGLQPSLGL
jgi:hypothetical protein